MAAPADFRTMVVKRRDACVEFKDKQGKDRKEALRFYRGDNLSLYGDSGDGLSTVVSRDMMEAVESLMPPLLRPFVAGEEVVTFDPIEEGDKDSTRQASDYVNHVFRRHNNVLDVTQTALKDGLMFRLGVAKTVVEEEEGGAPETFEGVTPEELQAAEASGREFVGDIEQDEMGLLYFTLAPKTVKRFKVYPIAPDEFLYEERLASLKKATFLGHTMTMTVGDLIELGIDEKLAKSLTSGEPTEEADERFPNEDQPDEWKQDDLARPVRVDECYIRCDYKGSGTLEWRKVLLGGASSKLLTDEPADDHPYSTWTPVPVPHKLVGLSMYDLTRDVQMNKTAVQREINNALYLANRPMREVLDGQVNIDDLLNPKVGGLVRSKQMGSVANLPSGGEAAFSAGFQAIEYFDSVREARTGVTRYNQGMDANSLNKTATGMSIISNASQQRQELIARQFGEFLKDIFEKVLQLVVQHAEPEEVERLTGKPFVDWPTQYDAMVSVGLGTNNKDQLVAQLSRLMEIDAQIIQLQQGINGPLLTAENVYEKLKDLQEAMGIRTGGYYTDPAVQQALPAPEQQEQPEDPLAETKIKAETDIAEAQIKAEAELEKERMRQNPLGLVA